MDDTDSLSTPSTPCTPWGSATEQEPSHLSVDPAGQDAAGAAGTPGLTPGSVASLTPSNLRGSPFGLLAGVQSFGNLVASAVAGVLWTAFSPTVAFLYPAGWMLVALAVLLRLTLQQRVAQ